MAHLNARYHRSLQQEHILYASIDYTCNIRPMDCFHHLWVNTPLEQTLRLSSSLESELSPQMRGRFSLHFFVFYFFFHMNYRSLLRSCCLFSAFLLYSFSLLFLLFLSNFFSFSSFSFFFSFSCVSFNRFCLSANCLVFFNFSSNTTCLDVRLLTKFYTTPTSVD